MGTRRRPTPQPQTRVRRTRWLSHCCGGHVLRKGRGGGLDEPATVHTAMSALADGRRRESAWERSKGPVAWVYRQQTLGRGGGGGASCCRCHCDGPSHVNYTHSCHCFIRTHAHTYTLTTKHTPAHVVLGVGLGSERLWYYWI